MRIAIVNDMAEKSEKMETALKSLGKELALELEVTYFSSGEAFLAAFESGSFDIVFMDIYMNGISVTETAARMREKDCRCVLIFLTTSMEHYV